MLDLATLASRRASRTFEFEGEQVTITFFPHKITPEYRAKLAALADKAKQAADEGQDEQQAVEQKQQDAQMIADLLDGWDVLAAGEKFPPTYENLLLVPVTLLSRVSSEIMEVIQELSNPTRKKR